MCATDAGNLTRAASELSRSAGMIVAAAAVLGENQRQEEEPGRLSAVGGALSNAARELGIAAEALEVERSWDAAAEALGDAALSLQTAAASSDGEDEAALLSAASELEDASTCTGCISLAAAAGPNLSEAGVHLKDAAALLRSRSSEMAAGATSAHGAAGSHLEEAADALHESGVALAQAGEQLEAGQI